MEASSGYWSLSARSMVDCEVAAPMVRELMSVTPTSRALAVAAARPGSRREFDTASSPETPDRLRGAPMTLARAGMMPRPRTRTPRKLVAAPAMTVSRVLSAPPVSLPPDVRQP